MVKMSDAPKSVVGPRPKTKEEFAAQNKRIQEWYDREVMREIEEAANKRKDQK